MENYQALWQVVQQVVPGTELEPATLQIQLEQYRGRLLSLHHNKVSSNEIVRTDAVAIA